MSRVIDTESVSVTNDVRVIYWLEKHNCMHQKAVHEMLIPTNKHGFTVGGPKPVRHLYYVQLVISLDERLAHRT